MEKGSYYDSLHSDLVWACLRKNASFLVKQKSGKPIFLSREPLNPLNKHMYIYSGLSNDKALSVEPNKNNKGIVLLVKNTSKTSRNKPACLVNRICFSPRRPFSFISQHIKRFVLKKKYRPDLQEAALYRARLFLYSQRTTKKLPVKRYI
ncbi:unnamed protein product [Pneumocystis jirovecii]|uniref:Ribosomal eL28/Mak16 domain-containing protein n=1 Tax=Pneumocystis jirovecii TaxID=42068 RepID=L0PF02_PNEJI|nr:unnamed protein product [Pneumocystis jirovecii]